MQSCCDNAPACEARAPTSMCSRSVPKLMCMGVAIVHGTWSGMAEDARTERTESRQNLWTHNVRMYALDLSRYARRSNVHWLGPVLRASVAFMQCSGVTSDS
jgi:hypothetical protein